jgi:hypothetical protein
MRLYAPIEGFVQEIAINTIGGVVTSAQELMSIVPIGKLSFHNGSTSPQNENVNLLIRIKFLNIFFLIQSNLLK